MLPTISSDRTKDLEYTSKQEGFLALTKFLSNNVMFEKGAIIKTDCVIEKITLHLQIKAGQKVKDFGSSNWLPAMPISISCLDRPGIQIPEIDTRTFASNLANYYLEKPKFLKETILFFFGIFLIIALRGHT